MHTNGAIAHFGAWNYTQDLLGAAFRTQDGQVLYTFQAAHGQLRLFTWPEGRVVGGSVAVFYDKTTKRYVLDTNALRQFLAAARVSHFVGLATPARADLIATCHRGGGIAGHEHQHYAFTAHYPDGHQQEIVIFGVSANNRLIREFNRAHD